MSSRKDVTFYFLGKDTPSGTPIGAPHSRSMTATGSHEYFYSLRGAPPQGKANLRRVGSLLQSPTVHPLSRLWRQLPLHRGAFFSVPSALTSIFTALSLQASGRGVPPPLHAKSILRPAPHPATSWPLSSGMTATGSHIDSYSLRGAQPPGEGIFPSAGQFCLVLS